MESDKLSGLFADRYSIEHAIGRGGSATVYLAHDTRQDRQIALKVLDNEVAHALGTKRFLQEIHITSRLQHPHILPIHDSGEWEGLLYYVLPFVAGESLRARLDREKQLPIDDCVQLTCDVASALAHAHSKGVIHRDVKPENILLSDGHALVADFGIARTIDVHTGERLTSSGLIVGTSQYMSPEQASGEREIDARSDIYSLGCVLYEMVAGIEPFVGPNVQAVIAQRFTHTPRPAKTYRPSLPDNLEHALEKALAVSPADRFQTMKDFAAALPAAAGSSIDRRRPGRALRDVVRTRAGKLGLVGAVALMTALIAAALNGKTDFTNVFAPRTTVDTALYVVLPLLDERGTVSSRGKTSASSIYGALQGWKGLNIVPDVAVEDALRKSGDPAVLTDALSRARELGAGRLIWGRIGRLQFFDVTTGARLREVDSTGDSAQLKPTLLKLFRDPSWPREADAGLEGTSEFNAMSAYGRAHAFLKRWELPAAQREFDRAASADNAFAAARFWSAQVRSWQESPSAADSVALAQVWARDATYAASHVSALSPRDAPLARALGALAVRDLETACKEYRKSIAADSMEFIAWHGLGKCLMLDEVVVRSARSPSGFAFRSSYAEAAASFFRATRLDPKAHAIVTFNAMLKLLVTSPTTVRGGKDPASGTRFFAYPIVSADTLGYVPYPPAVFATLPAKGRHDALDRNARSLLAFTTSWVDSDPRNHVAWEAIGSVLEMLGMISTPNSPQSNAAAAVARALSLTSVPVTRVRLLTRQVRILIKRGEFAAASRIADSVIANTPDTVASTQLLVLAAFTGKVGHMIRLAELSNGWIPIAASQYTLMPDLVSTAAELFARASLGECGPTNDRLQQTFDNKLESYTRPEDRDAVRHVLMSRTYSLLSPCTNGASALLITRPENILYRLQQSFARNDRRELRARLDTLTAMRAESRPGDRPADFTYQEAWILGASGDTAAAIRKLDLALNALASMSSQTLAQPAAAAAIGRMMVLRADLAARQGDAATARRWGQATSELWAFSDKPLAPTVARMRTLAAGR